MKLNYLQRSNNQNFPPFFSFCPNAYAYTTRRQACTWSLNVLLTDIIFNKDKNATKLESCISRSVEDWA